VSVFRLVLHYECGLPMLSINLNHNPRLIRWLDLKFEDLKQGLNVEVPIGWLYEMLQRKNMLTESARESLENVFDYALKNNLKSIKFVIFEI